MTILDLLCSPDNPEILASMSEARRLLSMGGVKVNGVPVSDPDTVVSDGQKVQIGRRVKFAVQIPSGKA